MLPPPCNGYRLWIILPWIDLNWCQTYRLAGTMGLDQPTFYINSIGNWSIHIQNIWNSANLSIKATTTKYIILIYVCQFNIYHSYIQPLFIPQKFVIYPSWTNHLLQLSPLGAHLKGDSPEKSPNRTTGCWRCWSQSTWDFELLGQRFQT